MTKTQLEQAVTARAAKEIDSQWKAFRTELIRVANLMPGYDYLTHQQRVASMTRAFFQACNVTVGDEGKLPAEVWRRKEASILDSLLKQMDQLQAALLQRDYTPTETPIDGQTS